MMKLVKNHREATGKLGGISLENQVHPELTPDTPFDIISEYWRGPQSELKGDVHYCLQLSIVLCGAAEVVCGGCRRIYHKNELWWTMCWEPHAFRLLEKRNVILTVNLNIDTLGNLGPGSGETDWLAPFTADPEQRYCPKSAAEHREMGRVFRELFRLHSRQQPNWRIRCWLLIHQLILTAAEHMSPFPGDAAAVRLNMNRIQQAVHLVRTSAIPPSLQEAAALCHLSVSRFSALFSSVMGASYGQFSLRVRLSKAAYDLKSGTFTLNDIAEKYGFCDASSFCNAFKKIYGCTPSNFKRRH